MKISMVRGQKVSKDKKELSKDLRKDQTTAEQEFWEIVRNRKLGVKFRRQQVIEGFIVDFFCAEKELVVEIDGGVHENQKKYDTEREKALKDYGLRIIRFKNEEIMKNKNRVIERLKNILK